MIGILIKYPGSPQFTYSSIDGENSLEKKIEEKNPANLDSIKKKLAKEFETLPENIFAFYLYKD